MKKAIAAVCAALIVGGGVGVIGYGSKGFKNWDLNTWFKSTTVSTTTKKPATPDKKPDVPGESQAGSEDGSGDHHSAPTIPDSLKGTFYYLSENESDPVDTTIKVVVSGEDITYTVTDDDGEYTISGTIAPGDIEGEYAIVMTEDGEDLNFSLAALGSDVYKLVPAAADQDVALFYKGTQLTEAARIVYDRFYAEPEPELPEYEQRDLAIKIVSDTSRGASLADKLAGLNCWDGMTSRDLHSDTQTPFVVLGEYLTAEGEDWDCLVLSRNDVASYLISAFPEKFLTLNDPNTDLFRWVSDKYIDQFGFTLPYLYTVDGSVKGVSLAAQSGVVIYNAALAETYISASDPDSVSAALRDFDTFLSFAEAFHDNRGDDEYLLASIDEFIVAMLSNPDCIRQADGEETIGGELEAIAEAAKRLVDLGVVAGYDMYSSDWSDSFADGNVMCYFGPLSFLNYVSSIPEDAEGYGLYRICESPIQFSYGSDYIVLLNSDMDQNDAAVLINSLFDMGIYSYIYNDGEYIVPNSKSIVETLSESEDMRIDCIGGQNPYPIVEKAKDFEPIGLLDESIQNIVVAQLKLYAAGETSYEDVIAAIEQALSERVV